MNIYVAGKTHDLLIVREVQAWLRSEGHFITHDWTRAVENHGADHDGATLSRNDAKLYAIEDIHGVRTADAVIVIPHERWCGSLIEIGAALITNTPVLILGMPHQRCVFWAHPMVRMTPVEWRYLHPSYLNEALRDLACGKPPQRIEEVPVNGRQ
jgi:hypothetical protein